MTLTSGQRKHLRGLSHSLSAAVHVGKQGLTDGVVEFKRKGRHGTKVVHVIAAQ